MRDYFYYDDTAINYLKQRDDILAHAIDRIGFIKRKTNTKRYESLITQIIAQQVSKKAAITVFERLSALVKDFDAQNISQLSVEDIQGCGMTYRKANNIKVISEMIVNKHFSLDGLDKLTNDEIIKKLSELPGIGVWTAQMYLIFTLLRTDVISYGDLAIRQGIIKLYKLDDLSKKDFNEYEQRYGQYASVASLYLWHIAHEEIIDIK